MGAPHEETLARSAVYELLSIAFLYPRKGAAALLSAGAGEAARAASGRGWSDVQAALEAVARDLDGLDDARLAEEYVEVFGHSVSADCPPYEGEYGQAHVFQKSQTLADLGTFYRAFGVGPRPDLKDRLDHVSVEMEFMHLLTLKEAHALLNGHGEQKTALCRQAQEAFLANHLANWITAFTRGLAGKCGGTGVLASVASLLETYMSREFGRYSLDSTPLRAAAPAGSGEAAEDVAACPAADVTPQEVVST